ncbi:MAG TPA: hypothetical protein VN861_17900 [Candidatus Acidoferrales bacterium]|jgi:hypothetical protein|nr:hypothetical protein [Candidatus Acidoferrales bacterium]
MTYTKPEIAVVGEAAQLIQGGKMMGGADGHPVFNLTTSACELDD